MNFKCTYRVYEVLREYGPIYPRIVYICFRKINILFLSEYTQRYSFQRPEAHNLWAAATFLQKFSPISTILAPLFSWLSCNHSVFSVNSMGRDFPIYPHTVFLDPAECLITWQMSS